MEFHPLVVRQLDSLSAALADGTDLQAILSVLLDDLTTAIPSLLGFELRLVIHGRQICLTTVPNDALPIRSSLLIPLDKITHSAADGSVVFYAHTGGALERLAVDTRRFYGLDGEVMLDRHLETDPTATSGIGGLEDLGAINQAVGVLIEAGHTPDAAREELRDRATRQRVTESAIARALIDHTAVDSADHSLRGTDSSQ